MDKNRRIVMKFALGGAAHLAGLKAMPALANKTENSIRFATWNLGCAAPSYLGRGLEAATDWILENDVDVVSFQETDQFASKSHFVDFADYFEERTNFEAFYQASSIENPHEPDTRHRRYGNCLLSRFPMTSKHAMSLVRGPHHAEDVDIWGRDNRVLVLAEARLPDSRKIWLAGTHLSSSGRGDQSIYESIRAAQAANMMEYINMLVSQDAPLLLGGDMNCESSAQELSVLFNRMSCHTHNIGPTWPLSYKKEQQEMLSSIDHIFSSGPIKPASEARVYPLEQISDHALVVMDFTV
jgi:endonuclease/exonuclease/phosphatase family metal-dependent hydrolase